MLFKLYIHDPISNDVLDLHMDHFIPKTISRIDKCLKS